MPNLVTLLTDFGYQDSYVAEMKGALLSVNPGLSIVDITHAIPPQDVRHGAYVLNRVINRFPADTIHIAVVDPGVGTSRKSLVVLHERGLFLGPDNGILTPVLCGKATLGVHEISNRVVMADFVSPTFHGRDVFAPAAAHASLGVDPETFGPTIRNPIVLEQWPPEEIEGGARGRVTHVDRFGNVITNLNSELFEGKPVNRVAAGECILDRLSRTYADVAPGETVALIGSQGTLEISLNRGNAADTWKIERGAEVLISWVLPERSG